ncbi:S8 family serine peptidase [Aquimarina celericrescens]|nr:S8 family serine peptidase [Aquimarina celericrescens]
MKKILLILTILFYAGLTSAQEVSDTYDLNEVKKLEEKFQEQHIVQKEKIENYLSQHPNVQKTIFSKNNKKFQVVDIINNKPVYRSTDNANSARATKTNTLHSGGSLGLNLEGQNMNIGVWDGGYVLGSHVEFTNAGNSESRVSYPDAFSSNPPTEFHGTHVAGTIGAQGVNPNAKGMAPQSNILSYTWDNDEAEVTAAAANSLLISNHSYGVPIYNDNNELNVPVWYMGCYNTDAKDWDDISNSMPYYLAVFSAGNDGQQSYEGGFASGYDKLNGNKNSKNNLVVANANASVNPITGEITTFSINNSSSQGPSDDGRIKPDIAGEGTGVFSTSNSANDEYGTSTGTSMASPNVAGSLLLLQQYYEQLNDSYMRAATLKGLVCHTATDDNFRVGPDPRFGWGLLNSEDAALLIADDVAGIEGKIIESTLNNNATFTIQVTTNDPQSLQASLSWNDPSGQDMSGSLNSTTPVLVNDLDLRIIDSDNNEYFPWRLDINNVNSAANKGDNIVDNIEKVELNNSSATAQTYTIQVTHKDNLVGDAQDFSLIISGTNSIELSTKNLNKNKLFNVWPNPANNFINITSEKSDISDYDINLYDLQGRMIMKNIDTETVNISTLSKGLYILDFRNGNQSFQKKIIKE